MLPVQSLLRCHFSSPQYLPFQSSAVGNSLCRNLINLWPEPRPRHAADCTPSARNNRPPGSSDVKEAKISFRPWSSICPVRPSSPDIAFPTALSTTTEQNSHFRHCQFAIHGVIKKRHLNSFCQFSADCLNLPLLTPVAQCSLRDTQKGSGIFDSQVLSDVPFHVPRDKGYEQEANCTLYNTSRNIAVP